MKSIYGFILLSCSLLAFTACSQTSLPPSQVQQVQDPGEALFMANCSGCHGGGGNALMPEKPVKKSSKLASLNEFSQFVRKPSGNMPAFSPEQLTEEQLGQLYQYVTKTYH